MREPGNLQLRHRGIYCSFYPDFQTKRLKLERGRQALPLAYKLKMQHVKVESDRKRERKESFKVRMKC